MDKKQIKINLENLKKDFDLAYKKLDIDSELIKLSELENQTNLPEIWNNPENAQKIIQNFKQKQSEILPWQELKMQINDYGDLLEVAEDDWLEEVYNQLKAMQDKFSKLKKNLMFNGQYDKHNVILRLTSGVGGNDAQDFTQMLERMYLRFFEKNNLQSEIIERSVGDEAGIKTSVISVKGSFAYGKLKSEHGVHRLVRKSPFNSDGLRQTSFALVEVLPEIEDEELNIDENDLRIDVYRSGGHGGQSVNTTDSAVRITHIPTNTVVAIQNERSQLQNRATAMSILRAKLLELKKQQQAESIKDLKAGESASWGMQIRNYVMHPYTLVKDTRTKYEETDIEAVLDGNLNGFIEAYLNYSLSQNN